MATLVVSNSLDELVRLQPFVSEVVAKCNVSEDMEGTINLALEEALVNVMLYAYPKGQEAQIRLDAIHSDSPNTLAFVITDSGVAFDPTSRPSADITLPVEERPIGGLGIFLVKNIMDEVTYRRIDGHNELTMLKRI